MRYKKGSIVEVLSKNEVPSGSWRCAEIICVNGHNYTVRYEMDPGATNEAIVERVSRKSIRPCPPPLKLSENCVPGDVVEDLCAARSNNNFQESHIVSSRTLNRGLPDCYSQVDAPARTSQKFRVIAKEGRCHHLLAANPFPLKIDAVLSHREMQGEKNFYTSFNSRTTHFTEVDVEREKPSGADGCSHAVSLEPNDADNITCTLASCGITSNDSFKLRCNFSRGPVEDTEGNCSDAESVCHRGFKEGNCFLPRQVELAEEIHRLELHAYRCTIEALHALGPLSWEQETLVTNLRLSLHISNDEHLMELRNLVSTATSMPLS
ncbi:hypothetical protein LOK49_LG13G00344 [Camellia lanceoleosa]|uniref:Uncharacterized protein n=1 Tax=Camellia lanceoleosa TaxID=1840588 RepID=A0ACC0FHB4_9ERIC|nr:hypothetical protein LOK49_LG13G00344 [Camellia lanceoleosa]